MCVINLFCTVSVKLPFMKLFLISVSILCFFSAPAQELLNKDSLLRLLPQYRDSAKVELLIQIGQQYEGSEPEVSKHYYRQARDLSKKIGYRLGEIKFATNYTFLLNMQGYYDSSLLFNLEGERLAQEIQHPEYMAKTAFNTGNSYRLLEEYELALAKYLDAYPLFERIDNPFMKAQALDIIQGLFTQLKQYRRSITYGKQAIALLEKGGHPLLMAMAVSNLGMNYTQLRIYDSALNYYQESLRLALQNENKHLESAAYLNIGDVYLKTMEYEKIEPYMKKALSLSKELGSFTSQAIAYRGISYSSFYRKQYERAGKYADSSLAIAIQHDLKPEMQKTYAHLANLSFALQQHQQGDWYSMKAAEINDSLVNESIQKRTIEMDKKYQTALKDTQIDLQQASLKVKTIWNYVLAGGALAITLVSILIYRNYRQRQRLQEQRITELETEKQLAATGAVLKGEEQERTRLAKDLHDGLGGMLSGIKYALHTVKGNLIMTPENAQSFERSLDMLDSSIREMRRVAHNMMREALVKFGLDIALQDFCNDINKSGALQVSYQSIGLEGIELEQTKAITIYRIVQELLNNIMKHAAATNAIVQISRNEKQLSVTVEDDGKGFDESVLRQSKGIGWSNIQHRIEFLKGHWEVDSEPGKGTSVHIELSST